MKRPIDVTELCEIENKIIQAALISIISKFEDWEYEKEWRLIFYLGDEENRRLEISTAPKPEFIILGNRFFDNLEKARFSNRVEFLLIEKFIDLVKQKEIDLKIVKPQIKSFQLEYVNIDVDEIIRKFR